MPTVTTPRDRSPRQTARTTLAASFVFVAALSLKADAQLRPTVRWSAGGHGASVERVAYSPDGQLAASASGDDTAKVWRVADGQLLHTFTAPVVSPSVIHDVHFAPDGQSLVLASSGGGYRVRVSDGAILGEYCCIETGYASDFSPGGQFLAVSGSETGLEEATLIIRVSDGAIVRTLIRNVQHYVFGVAFTPDGTHVITGSGSVFGGTLGVIRYWRLSDGVETRTINAHAARIIDLAVSSDGTLLATASSDGTAKLWDLATGAFIRSFTGHVGEVTGVCFSPDGQQLATSGVDATIRVWATGTGALVRTISGHTGAVGSVDWSPDGTQLLSGGGRLFSASGDATVRTWSAVDGAPEEVFTQHTRSLESVAASPDGALVATGGQDGSILLRDAITGDLVRTIPNGSIVMSLAFTPDSGTLAAGGYDKVVRLFDVASGALLRTLTGHTASVEGLACSPDGVYVVAGDWDGPARVWRISDGAFIADFTTGNVGARTLAFSPDGQSLLVGGGNFGQIRSFPAGTVLRTLSGHTSAVLAVDFSPQGDQVVTASIDRSVRTWNAATGSLIRTLSGHTDWVETAAYSSDGRLLVSGSRNTDRTLRVWNPHTGGSIAVYDLEAGSGILAAAALPQRGFAYVRRDGTSLVIEPPPPAVAGDWNYDNVVNMPDVLALPPCISGPFSESDWTAPSANCRDVFDVDADADIDLEDIAMLQDAFGA